MGEAELTAQPEADASVPRGSESGRRREGKAKCEFDDGKLLKGKSTVADRNVSHKVTNALIAKEFDTHR
jgi:hypothetical protein